MNLISSDNATKSGGNSPPIRFSQIANVKNKVMVFDVETTGLLQKPKKNEVIDLKTCPYVIQFSYLLYDLEICKIVKVFNNYIHIPENVIIPELIVRMTGVTKKMCEEKGIYIEDALKEFYDDYQKCDVIVAHNLEFDRSMIELEWKRYYSDSGFLQLSCPNALRMFSPDYLQERRIELYCTMMKSISYCKIPKATKLSTNTESGTIKIDCKLPETISEIKPEEKKPPKNFKYPKLSELHEVLFGYVPDNLHDSLIDIFVCLRCYLKRHLRYTIERNEFEEMIKTIRDTEMNADIECGIEYEDEEDIVYDNPGILQYIGLQLYSKNASQKV
jgi:DNA polymerase III epsilon subunit-like protein